jgi:hypothetical protein
MNAFEKQVLVIALKKMFEPSHFFSVSDFKAMLKTVGVTLADDEMRPFDLLHCTHYKDMPQDFRVELARRVLEVLGRRPDVVVDFDAAFNPKPPALELLPPPSRGIKKFLGL